MTKVVEKVKSCCVGIKENWNENKTAKAVKILCFFVGFFFNIIGIICVAVWKYIFSNPEKSKYCIRMAFLGMVAEIVLCAKIFTYVLFPSFSSNINRAIADEIKAPKIERMHKYKPVHHVGFYFDDFFDKEFERMHRAFEEQQAMFDRMFSDHEQEMKRIEKEMENKHNNKDINIKKEIKTENGFETKTIEKTGPNSYSQHVSIRYVGDNTGKKESKHQPLFTVKKDKTTKKNDTRKK